MVLAKGTTSGFFSRPLVVNTARVKHTTQTSTAQHSHTDMTNAPRLTRIHIIAELLVAELQAVGGDVRAAQQVDVFCGELDAAGRLHRPHRLGNGHLLHAVAIIVLHRAEGKGGPGKASGHQLAQDPAKQRQAGASGGVGERPRTRVRTWNASLRRARVSSTRCCTRCRRSERDMPEPTDQLGYVKSGRTTGSEIFARPSGKAWQRKGRLWYWNRYTKNIKGALGRKCGTINRNHVMLSLGSYRIALPGAQYTMPLLLSSFRAFSRRVPVT